MPFPYPKRSMTEETAVPFPYPKLSMTEDTAVPFPYAQTIDDGGHGSAVSLRPNY